MINLDPWEDYNEAYFCLIVPASWSGDWLAGISIGMGVLGCIPFLGLINFFRNIIVQSIFQAKLPKVGPSFVHWAIF
jgi:hypothetical protein